MYVLRKDLPKPGPSPYVLDDVHGDMPRSSIDVLVEMKDGLDYTLRLEQYLSIPPPRTTRTDIVGRMLAEQYPDIIRDVDAIKNVLFMPFVEGGVVRGRSTSGVRSSSSLGSDSDVHPSSFEVAQQETSFRYPSCLAADEALKLDMANSLMED